MSAEGAGAGDVALVSDGATVLALWAQDPEVPFGRALLYGRRLGGASPDAAPFRVSDADGAQAAAAFLDTGDVAVAWVSRESDVRGDIHTRVLRSSGDPLAGSVERALTSTPPMGASVMEVAPSVLPLPGGAYLVSYEDGLSRRVSVAPVGSPSLAPEYPTLLGHLGMFSQGDVTLLSTPRGHWFAWSASGPLGDPRALRSFLAYLLPPS